MNMYVKIHIAKLITMGSAFLGVEKERGRKDAASHSRKSTAVGDSLPGSKPFEGHPI